MQGVDSIPGIKLKPGINNDSNRLAFLQLEELMAQERLTTDDDNQIIRKLAPFTV